MGIWDLIAAIYTANANKPKDPKVTTATTPNEDWLFNQFRNSLTYDPARSYTDEYANQFLQGMNQPGSAAHYSPKFASPQMAGQTVPSGPTIDFNKYMPAFWRSDYKPPTGTGGLNTPGAGNMPPGGLGAGGGGGAVEHPRGPLNQGFGDGSAPWAGQGILSGIAPGGNANDPYQFSDDPNSPNNPANGGGGTGGFSFGQGGVILDASGKPVMGTDGKPMQAVPWDGNTSGIRTVGNFVVNAVGAVVGILTAPNPISGAVQGWRSADGIFHHLFGNGSSGGPTGTGAQPTPPVPVGGTY